MKNSTKLSLLATVIMLPTAQAEISGNVAIQSDYVWRGISQNMEDPSIQGGFDYAHSSGAYIGIWGANVDFGATESTEMDIYAGWATEFESGFGLDLGVIEYTYHGSDGASDANFTEAYLGLSYAGFGLTYYAGDEFDDNIELSYGYDFAGGISLGATFSDYDSYKYYQAGVSAELAGLGFDLSYWDTDISLDETGDPMAFSKADNRIVLTVSKEF